MVLVSTIQAVVIVETVRVNLYILLLLMVVVKKKVTVLQQQVNKGIEKLIRIIVQVKIPRRILQQQMQLITLQQQQSTLELGQFKIPSQQIMVMRLR